MADDMTEGNVLHSNHPKPRKQSGKTKLSSSRAKKPGRGEEIRDEKQRLKELETTIRSQVAAEERAHKIVQRLVLEDKITRDILITSGNFITTSHYADVVEERMLSKKCGYPLCNTQLNQIPSQKYKISLKTNKVYDITERKCFCSNFCFKASKYFESQISASPVWTRIGESPRTLALLESDSNTNRTATGDVLLGTKDEQEIVSDVIIEHGDLDDMDFADESKRSICGVSAGNAQELSEENHPQSTISENSAVHGEDCSTNYPSSSSYSSSSVTRGLDQSLVQAGQLPDKPCQAFKISPEFTDSKSQFALLKERIQDSKEGSVSRDTIIHSVQTVFQEWCTHSTLEYLSPSPEKDNESVFPEAKDPDSFKARVTLFYQRVGKKEEDSDSDSESGTSLGIVKEDIAIKEKKNLKWDPVCIVPPIDSKSQTTIRRRIVLDKLFRTMQDLLSEVKLTVGEISRDLTELVHTFSLSSKNVTLKPFQWKILALAFIIILERKNSLISQALDSYKENWNTLLKRLEITRKDIDQVLSPLSPLKAQHAEHFKSVMSEDEAFRTSESSNGKSVIFNDRNDYGDMEELD